MPLSETDEAKSKKVQKAELCGFTHIVYHSMQLDKGRFQHLATQKKKGTVGETKAVWTVKALSAHQTHLHHEHFHIRTFHCYDG